MRHRLLFVTRTTTRGRDRGPPRSTRVGSTSDLRVIRARSNAWEGEENLIEYGMSQFTTDNRDRQRLEELRDALWGRSCGVCVSPDFSKIACAWSGESGLVASTARVRRANCAMTPSELRDRGGRCDETNTVRAQQRA
jgi:hypothetical protein